MDELEVVADDPVLPARAVLGVMFLVVGLAVLATSVAWRPGGQRLGAILSAGAFFAVFLGLAMWATSRRAGRRQRQALTVATAGPVGDAGRALRRAIPLSIALGVVYYALMVGFYRVAGDTGGFAFGALSVVR